MALELLRRAIFDETKSLKSPKSDVLARTFYLVLSPSMGHLQNWFHEWFPDSHEAIRHVHPWYITDKSISPDKLKENLRSIFLGAFSANVTNKLINNGHRLLNTATQVIIIGDLSEEGFGQYLESVHTLFKEIVAEFGNHESPVYFTGIFLCRSLTKNADGNIEVKTCGHINDILKSKDELDRVFLIDISNSSGVVVSKETDMHFLVGQLLYILSKKPLEFSEEKNFAAFGEWLRRFSPRNNLCSGFSGISILNPIDQMLETLLIAKGGEILDGAFFGDIDEKKVDFYTKSLLNNVHLNSLDVFSKMLKENGKTPLVNPFKNIESVKASWNINQPDDFSAFIDYLDSHLPDDAEENRKIMDGLGQLLLDNFRYELLEHLNTAISNEKGGILIAEQFLSKLKKMLNEMMPEKVTGPLYPDISNLIHSLVTMCNKGPRKESVIARTAVLFLAGIAGLFSSQAIFDLPFIVFPLLTILATAVVTVYWYGSKNKIEKLVSDVWKYLFEKWDILMAKEFSATLNNLRPQYIEIIDDLALRVEESQKRLHEVIAFFKNQYAAVLPDDSAFWLYAINKREEFIKYLPMLQTNMQTIASAYLEEDRPLELWNRTAPPVDTTELNEWEWTLGERIGLRLLPYARNIVDLSVSRLLNDSPAQTKAFIELLKSAAQPFLCVKPGNQRCIPQATIEMPDDGSDTLYKQIETTISGSFQSKERKRSMTPYRISLFSFAESIDIDSLKAGG
ncbi:MAG: hypothetical protein EHM85_02915 [Desulfobacteraceae bacterium]|nr:MAG: hypothetical protein EHM85_02915 [Desulfobacteraceae bacterium]